MKQHLSEQRTWQQGVDELECLEDGVNPVNPDSWSIISKRLYDEKKKNRTWYWIAAAIAAVILTFWLGGRMMRQASVSTNDAQQNIVVSPKQKAVMNPGITKDSMNYPAPVNKIIAKKHTDKIKTGPGMKQIIPVKDSVIVQVPEIVKSTPANTKEKPDTIAVVRAIPKKVLGVSHINDYVETIESTPGVTMKVQPLRRFIRGTRDESIENAAAATPVKPHNLIKSSTIQN